MPPDHRARSPSGRSPLRPLKQNNALSDRDSAPPDLQARTILSACRVPGRHHTRTLVEPDHCCCQNIQTRVSFAVDLLSTHTRQPSANSISIRPAPDAGALGIMGSMGSEESSAAPGPSATSTGRKAVAARVRLTPRARRQRYTRERSISWRRATSVTVTPDSSVSETICSFSAFDQFRRRSAPLKISIR